MIDENLLSLFLSATTIWNFLHGIASTVIATKKYQVDKYSADLYVALCAISWVMFLMSFYISVLR